MKIIIERSRFRLELEDGLIDRLDKRFSYLKKSDMIRKRMFPYAKIEPVRLLRREHGNVFLPLGLGDELKAALSAFPDIEIEDRRGPPPKPSILTHDLEHVGARVDQAKVANELLLEPRGILLAETSYGKTWVAAYLIASLRVPTLFVAAEKSAVKQLAKKLQKCLGIPIGLSMSGHEPQGEDVVITTTQSAKKVDLAMFDMILCDESHGIAAPMYQRIIEEASAYYCYGFTGTPDGRSDGLDELMYAVISKRIVKGDEGKVKVTPIVLLLKVDCDPTTIGGWNDTYIRGIVKNSKRNELIIAAVNKLPKPLLLAVVRKDHAKYLYSRIAGSVMVDGNSSLKAREAAISEADVTILTRVMRQSVDMPAQCALIYAGGGAPTLVIKQLIGRLKRGTMEEIFIVDFMDRGNRILQNNANARRRMYRSNYEVRELTGI